MIKNELNSIKKHLYIIYSFTYPEKTPPELNCFLYLSVTTASHSLVSSEIFSSVRVWYSSSISAFDLDATIMLIFSKSFFKYN